MEETWRYINTCTYIHTHTHSLCKYYHYKDMGGNGRKLCADDDDVDDAVNNGTTRTTFSLSCSNCNNSNHSGLW